MLIGVMIFTTGLTQEKESSRSIVKAPEYTNGGAIETVEVKTLVKSETVDEKMSKDDIELIALVTMAEAEGESEKGKRLVISTILNRLDSEHFPNTVKEVIYQENQFSSIWDGRVDRCYVMEDICQLVREELENRTNSEVMFFRAGDYSDYGSPMYPEGDHYFSSYD